jgi:RNase adapter protein RapZ
MQLVLVSGLSGSGKSIALHMLEDSGFYCVDNLPAVLLPQVVTFLGQAGYSNVAVSIDIRSGTTLHKFREYLSAVRDQGVDVRVLFLEAKTETLVKRFSETRRRHPLSDGALTVTECIEREREILTEVAAGAHRIDTSGLNPSALRTWIMNFVQLDRSRLTLLFESFGFKQGIPLDADLVFDVRCLPNPNYNPDLKDLTGKDAPVIAFIAAESQAREMLEDIRAFVERWLPAYQADSRSYLTVAVGCTGGRHRSVYFAESLARYFRSCAQVLVRHRELA